MRTKQFAADYEAAVDTVSDWDAVYEAIYNKACLQGVGIGETFNYEARNNHTLKCTLFALTRTSDSEFKY